MEEGAAAAAALTTIVVGAASALAHIVNASPTPGSMPTPLDPLWKWAKTMKEDVKASNRSSVIAKGRGIGNLSLSSCNASLNGDNLSQPKTNLPFPPMPSATYSVSASPTPE
jgi:hypothetical protein